jgi:hypothetical protein
MPRQTCSWRKESLQHIDHIKGIAETWQAQTISLCLSLEKMAFKILNSTCHQAARGDIGVNLPVLSPQHPTPPELQLLEQKVTAGVGSWGPET